MMQNNTDEKTYRTDDIMKLRRIIYFLETANLHKKIPQSDPEMVDKIIKEIKRFVENEEVE